MRLLPFLLLMQVALAACSAVPVPENRADSLPGLATIPAKSIPDFCKTADAAGPTYSQADLAARIAERKSSLPEGAEVAPLAPIFRPAPSFPHCAMSYDVSGHCDIVFDVMPDGSTANILPVCSHRFFERDAAYAVSRWTFEPPGESARLAVLNRMTFLLDEPIEPPAPETELPPSSGLVSE